MSKEKEEMENLFYRLTMLKIVLVLQELSEE